MKREIIKNIINSDDPEFVRIVGMAMWIAKGTSCLPANSPLKNQCYKEMENKLAEMAYKIGVGVKQFEQRVYTPEAQRGSYETQQRKELVTLEKESEE